MAKLEIKNLHVTVEGNEILKGVDLVIDGNETHIIMGPNGTGKSTLSYAIMGHPKYHITEGDILLNGESIIGKTVDIRSKMGLFLAMQAPIEVNGVTNSDFIKQALQARLPEGENVPLFKFIKQLDKATKELKMPSDLPMRYLNEGFSGGEKKKNEVLQMKLLNPSIAILDELDSGLDVDALKIVSDNVNELKAKNKMGLLVITHYRRLLEYIVPTHVHIMINGRIVKNGGIDLLNKIDEYGYEWVKQELGIVDEERVMLGTCATKEALKNDK